MNFETFKASQITDTHTFIDQIHAQRESWMKKRKYYYTEIKKLVAQYVPHGSSVCHFGCDSPWLINHLKPSKSVGICLTQTQKDYCHSLAQKNVFYTFAELNQCRETFDYIIITSLGYVFDIQILLNQAFNLSHKHTKIILLNYNFLWEPIFKCAELLKLRMPQPLYRQNMISTAHIANLVPLASCQLVRWSSHLLVPMFIPFFSWVMNRLLAPHFPLRFLSSTDVLVIRPHIQEKKTLSVSVVIPCKNEKNNIEPIIRRMPKLADHTEIVFVDDKSNDGTDDEIKRCIEVYPDKDIKIVKGPGICKGEAVREGFRNANGDILAILDADIAVAPEELPKCIEPLLRGHADFVNTVRFIYPQQSKAMRWLNIAGNRAFALVFTILLRQRISDTLCGTKVFWKRDYKNIDDLKDYWLWRDKWGDFEQLLGAGKLGLKIVDVPVHYMERTYGETKMKNRFANGIHMLKLCLGGLIRLRF